MAVGKRIVVIALVAACGAGDTEPPTRPVPPPGLSPPRACSEVDPVTPDSDVPTLPVGADAYRDWAHWPIVRIGTRTYMRSTYDRTGGNYDGAHFLRKVAGPGGGDAEYVTLDVAGSGVLSFFRANHWHGSPWHFEVDGTDTIVTESSTADPDHPTSPSTFAPQDVFAQPFAFTWSVTRGADLSWVPVTFSSSLTLAYSRVHYGTGYYVYSLYPEGATNLSRTPCTWEKTPPAADAAALLGQTAEDIAKTVGVKRAAGNIQIPAEGTTPVLRIEDGAPESLRALAFDVAASDAAALARTTLRITWDDRSRPSVDAPLGLFFGTGSVFNRSGAEYLVRAFPTTVHFAAGHVRFTTIFPMPFARTASIAIVSSGAAVPNVTYEARWEPQTAPTNFMGYFHATFHDTPLPAQGRDVVFLDTTSDEGGGEWCGSFVGTSFTFSDRAYLPTLEGDPRFFFDDSGSPQAQGTGTEEWGGGGDYWGGATMTLPLAGHPTGAPGLPDAANAEDAIESAYRFLLADAMPFGRNARIQFEHGGADESSEHYRSVAYWYGLPDACLVLSDSLHVGDSVDERAHGWSARGASEVVALTSQYELGVDASPTTTDTGRTIAESSSFRLTLPAENLGVMLRRKLDYAIADQRAVVFVADDRDDAPFVRAGVWYLAGSSNVVFSDSLEETGVGSDTIQSSDRRWRDDEFLIPRALTAGRTAIRVRLDVVPQTTPLLPNGSSPPIGFSAFRLWAYAWSLPRIP